MHFSILLVASLTHAVTAQSCANANPTFTACVRNGMTTPEGMVGPTDPTSACASIQTQQAQYYACLCQKYNTLYQCFTSFCQGDPSVTSVSQSQTQFCQAAGQVSAVPSSTSSGSPVFSSISLPSGGGTVTGTVTGTTSTSAAASSNKPSQSGAGSFVLSNALVYGEFAAMLVLGNLL
ncbi:hypothetical protein HDV03_005048 [Kappamyces sp. JEL0829]|nr:hypothetical protein HDV03_005048 [Kappamyces sp. JEL0829]